MAVFKIYRAANSALIIAVGWQLFLGSNVRFWSKNIVLFRRTFLKKRPIFLGTLLVIIATPYERLEIYKMIQSFLVIFHRGKRWSLGGVKKN